MSPRVLVPPHLASLDDAERTAACLVALSYLDGVGPATIRRCHQEVGAVESWVLLAAGQPERVAPVADQLARMRDGAEARLLGGARTRDPVADLEAQRSHGRRVHVLGTPGYPTRLAADPEPPAVLFSVGRLELLDGPTVAIVGTRNATMVGRQLAEAMGSELVGAGVTVVSGLALGIDGAAHRGAIALAAADHGVERPPEDRPPEDPDQPARAVGVVASGLDVVYPRRHTDLHHRLARGGLLVSETPAGVRPDAWRFPARNRIIAGLADAVVVVESRRAGGSMHTVDEALARDVPVLAVPGHPSAPASAGTNALLYDGAGMARNAADVLLALGLGTAESAPTEAVGAALAPAALAVVRALAATPSSLAEVVARTGRPVDEVAYALATLEIGGLVSRRGAWYEVTAEGASRS